MAAHLNDAQKAEIVERRRAGAGFVEIAEAMGIGAATAHRYANEAARRGELLGQGPAMDGFQITKVVSKEEDGSFVTQRPEPEELILPDGHILDRASLKVGDSWYKTKRSLSMLSREAVEEAFAEWRGGSEVLRAPRGCDPTRLVLYPTADIHLGLLSWKHDAGVSWDLEIARDKLLSATSELIQLTPATDLAIMLDVGDQFHMNDQSNVTPMHKHQLDVDGRFPKVAKAAVQIRRAMIEMALQRHDRVLYRGLPGNHDPEAQLWLSIALSMFFENNPRVTIDDAPSAFWAYEFGKTFLFANHGDKVKPVDLPGLMAADYPEIWGRTEYKYAFSGHIHQEKTFEKFKVIVETLRTISPGDNYSFTRPWRSGHEMTSITFSAETGRGHRQFIPV